jgi:hypothetical protein
MHILRVTGRVVESDPLRSIQVGTSAAATLVWQCGAAPEIDDAAKLDSSPPGAPYVGLETGFTETVRSRLTINARSFERIALIVLVISIENSARLKSIGNRRV